MNDDAQQPPAIDARDEAREEPRERLPNDPPRRAHPSPGQGKGAKRSRILALAVVLLLCGALAVGFWQHYRLHAQVMSTAEQLRDFVPAVRAAPVRASASTMSVSWPGTTDAFEQANIFARASGYISKREVDIGSRVKAASCWWKSQWPRRWWDHTQSSLRQWTIALQ